MDVDRETNSHGDVLGGKGWMRLTAERGKMHEAQPYFEIGRAWIETNREIRRMMIGDGAQGGWVGTFASDPTRQIQTPDAG